MKRTISVVFVLFCLVVLIPAAFAAEDVAGTPRFNPSLRVGCAVDAGPTHYRFDSLSANGFGGAGGLPRIDIIRPSHARFYLGTDLPFAVTDRLTVALGADWAFTGVKENLEEAYIEGISFRSWDRDGRSDWVTADFLVSYALVKDVSVIRDLSVVGGLRWDYQNMTFDNPHDVLGVNSGPGNTFSFRMQTLAPVFGLDCTFQGIKSGVWGGDLKLGFLAGPVVWGTVDYKETFATPSFYRANDSLSHGYVVKVSGEATLLSGPITPGLDASLSVFIDYTRTAVHGTIEGRREAPFAPRLSTAPADFETKSDVVVFGLAASLAFDLSGRPEPVSLPAAPAPVIEPKLEPMSQK